jgi:ATP-binding cassette subfamily G (WHITE) protein 2 (SNQ2)
MFYTKSDRMFTENAEGRDGTRVPLHNVDDHGERPHQPEEVSGSSTGVDTPADDGTWGERDIGGPVNFRNAMIDYEEMRRELSHLSKSRTSKSEPRRPGSSALKKVSSAASRGSRTRGSMAVSNAAQDPDVEAQDDEKPAEEDEEEDFELGEFLKDGHFEKRQEGRSAKKVGVVYKHLTVQGVGATTTFVKTLPSTVLGVSYFPSPRCP